MRRIVVIGVLGVALSLVARIAATLGLTVLLGFRRANVEALEHYVGARRAA